ncbi:MAG: autotransporter outer membrane beta-barrel domain-containing protein [Pseudomonadota bacterium]
MVQSIFNPQQPMPSTLMSTSAQGGSGSDVLADFGRWGVWVGGRLIFGDKDRTEAQGGYDFNTGGLTVGVDYRFTESMVGGFALGYSDNEVDLDQNGGGLDSTGYSATLYGNWYPTDSFYIDASLGWGNNSFDQVRQVRYQLSQTEIAVDQTLEADFDGDQINATLGIGYDFVSNGWIFGPELYVEYVDVDLDPFTERLTATSDPNAVSGWAASIEGQSFESLLPTIGFQVSKAFSTSWGVIVPQGNLGWSKELENSGNIVSGFYVGDLNRVRFELETDELDSEFFRAGLGVSALFPGAKSAYLTVDGDFDRDLLSTYYVNAGFRWEF